MEDLDAANNLSYLGVIGDANLFSNRGINGVIARYRHVAQADLRLSVRGPSTLTDNFQSGYKDFVSNVTGRRGASARTRPSTCRVRGPASRA